MSKSFKTIIIVCLLAFAQILKAEQGTIGYLDTERLYKEAPQATAAIEKLRGEFDPRKERINLMKNELKDIEDAYDHAVTNKDNKRIIELERRKLSLERQIKSAQKEANEDFNLRKNEELIKLQDLIVKTTEQVAREQNIDMVITGNVIYHNRKVDITDKVLQKLRLEYKKDKPPSEAQ